METELLVKQCRRRAVDLGYQVRSSKLVLILSSLAYLPYTYIYLNFVLIAFTFMIHVFVKIPWIDT
jgi:hypothetical protein